MATGKKKKKKNTIITICSWYLKEYHAIYTEANHEAFSNQYNNSKAEKLEQYKYKAEIH